MAKNNPLWGRPEIPIAEAVEMLACDLQDLFFKAAQDGLAIYALDPYWAPARIYEYGFPEDDYDGPPTLHGCPLRQCDCYDPEQCDTYTDEDWDRIYDCNELIDSDGILYYARNGLHHDIFYVEYGGLQQVAQSVFKRHRSGSKFSPIELDITPSDAEPWHTVTMHLKDSVFLQDLIKDGKLFVKKEDVARMFSQRFGNPDDAKAEGAVSRKTLLKLVLGMAKGNGFDPTAKHNTHLGTIKKRVENAGFRLDDDTIRKALKEAAELPPDPPK